MLNFLPKFNLLTFWKFLKNFLKIVEQFSQQKIYQSEQSFCLTLASFLGALLLVIILTGVKTTDSALAKHNKPLRPLAVSTTTLKTDNKEVFGFLPYWNLDKTSTIDFNTLTTLAYFSVPISPDGSLNQSDPGYADFQSDQATALFQKAHSSGTKVVLTVSAMDNYSIENVLYYPDNQQRLISQIVETVSQRGIDGVNLDWEYSGEPDPYYRAQFSQFVGKLAQAMHQSNPHSYVTVSVYANTARDPKIYDLTSLAKNSDGVFMMAYDFATLSSSNAIPTDPLYGFKQGVYWYDVSTAVDDFLKLMPSNKLILGVPWYGYNYLVSSPAVNAPTLNYSWGGNPVMQTYSDAASSLIPNASGITNLISGWDPVGKVSWKAYYVPAIQTWRMIFLDDSNSLQAKYDFLKTKNLAGVGIWSLGYGNGQPGLWTQLQQAFGPKLADASVVGRSISQD